MEHVDLLLRDLVQLRPIVQYNAVVDVKHIKERTEVTQCDACDLLIIKPYIKFIEDFFHYLESFALVLLLKCSILGLVQLVAFVN